MRGTDPGHVTELLPAHQNGTLGAGDQRRVDEHLRVCERCRTELASWGVIQGAVEASREATSAPPRAVLAGVLEEIGRTETVSAKLAPRLSLGWQLLAGQLPLVKREIWTASAVTVGLGCLVALLIGVPSNAGAPLAVLAPVVAAVGVSLVYGPENDPSLEIALSTPTSPRLVLMARLILVYGYDLLLALAATIVLAAFGGATGGISGLWPLISLWIGPMLFLSTLALLVSLLASPTAAVLVALSLWAVRLLAAQPAPNGPAPAWASTVEALWQAESLLVTLAAALLIAALLYAPRAARTPEGGAAW